MATIDNLEVRITSDSTEASAGIKSLILSLQALKNVSKGGTGLTTTINQLQKLSTAVNSINAESVGKLNAISNALKSFENVGEIRISSSIANQIAEIRKATEGIDSEQIAKIKEFGDSLSGFAALNGVRSNAIRAAANPRNANAVNGIEESTAALNNNSEFGNVEPMEEFVRATDDANNVLARFEGALQSGMKGAGQFFSALRQGVSSIQSMKEGLSKLNPLTKLFGGSLGTILKKFKTIALTKMIRAVISGIVNAFKYGVDNLYNYSRRMDGAFSSTLDSLATSVNYLKNSLGAMASPIITAVAPAIEYIIGQLITAINLLNQFFSMLGGKSTYTAAIRNAKEYGGAVSDAVGGAGKGAGKAAKEIKDALLGIDELNMIKPEDSSGGGGGGGGGGGAGTDFGTMFEELPISGTIADLKNLIDQGDWDGVGRLLGDKINGIVDDIPWDTLGIKLGEGMNHAFDAYYGFMDEVDFNKIGESIATFFNNGIATVNWTKIGQSLVIGTTSLFDAIIGFITEFDFGNLASAFSNLITGMMNEVSRWLGSYNWYDIGSDIYDSVKDVFENLDYKGIATSFFTLLGNAIRAAVGLLEGIIEGLQDDISTYFKNLFDEIDTKGLDTVIYEKFSALFTRVGAFLWNNCIRPMILAIAPGLEEMLPEINLDTVDAKIEADSKAMAKKNNARGKGLGRGITTGLSSGLHENTNKLLSEAKSLGVSIPEGVGRGIHEADIGSKTRTAVTEGANGLVNGATVMRNAAKAIGDSIIEGFDKGNSNQSLTTRVQNIIGNSFGKIGSSSTGGGASAFGNLGFHMVTAFGTEVSPEKMGNTAGTALNGMIKAITSGTPSAKASATNLGTAVTKGYNDKAGSSVFSSIAKSTVTAFNSGISSNSGSSRTTTSSWGSNSKAGFTSVNSTNAYSGVAHDVVTGFNQGINKYYTTTRKYMSMWADDMFREFKKAQNSHSPSKLYLKAATWDIQGFNIGIDKGIASSVQTVTAWANKVSDAFKPTFAYEEPNLSSIVDPTSLNAEVQSDVATTSRVRIDDNNSEMRSFYGDVLQPLLVSIANDTKRQADKSEKTVVNIGGKSITETVNTQRRADGYSFT